MAGKKRAARDDRPSALLELGLQVGDRVRFRRRANGHWREATVQGREKDGSIAIRDADGAARAMPIERLEVRTRGPRGALAWEPLHERASRTEQLGLW
jgi:hypothetical protein